MPGRSRRGGAYVRISDDREGRELGVERQLEDLLGDARKEGIEIVDTYRDNDISASTKSSKRRPDYERLLADARKGRLDVIVAYSSSRLTRRPREHEDLIDLAVKHGIQYRFLRSPTFDLNTADGRMVARTLAAADAAEAERTAERVGREILQRAQRGLPHGGPRPYGIDRDGLSVVDAEAELIRSWYATVLAGGSIWGIASKLNEEGVPSAHGGRWRAPAIRRILLNERNAGLRDLNGETYPASHPEIVDPQIYRAVRDILTDEKRRQSKAPARKHLGTGLFICQRCERTVNIAYGAQHCKYYRCDKCLRSWRADPINTWINNLVERLIGAEDAAERLLPKADPASKVDVSALRDEAAAIRQNMKGMAAEHVLAKDAIRAALSDGLRVGQERLDEIDRIQAEVGRSNPLVGVLSADDPVAVWRGISDVVRRQAIIRALMSIQLGAPLRGRATWDANKFIVIGEPI